MTTLAIIAGLASVVSGGMMFSLLRPADFRDGLNVEGLMVAGMGLSAVTCGVLLLWSITR